ncbi:MAG TPA: ATP-dependent DNA helicase RecG, partial [Burkholderiales bacterium]|nr:ATP-dependent DNA helicase RecG [Burkholderiales bacterium]
MKRGGLERKLEKLGLRTGFDFVLHLPLRYEDETVRIDPGAAPPGQPVLVEARVQRAEVAFRPRRQLVVHAEGVVLRFYNFYPSQLQQFRRAAEEGLLVRAYGEVRAGWFGAEMAHPRYRLVAPGEPLPQALTPIYPSTAGVSQAALRGRVLEALGRAPLEDTLPEALRRRHGLCGFDEAVRLLHQPPPGIALAQLAERTHPAWRRMKFDELLAQQLSMRFAYRARRARRAHALPTRGPLLERLREQLPFALTAAQRRALEEVLRDLGAAQPMQRLLQGDVG